MLKSEESQTYRVKLIYFSQKVNEGLNVCDIVDPTLKTDLETHGFFFFLFFWYFLCEDAVFKLNQNLIN